MTRVLSAWCVYYDEQCSKCVYAQGNEASLANRATVFDCQCVRIV